MQEHHICPCFPSRPLPSASGQRRWQICGREPVVWGAQGLTDSCADMAKEGKQLAPLSNQPLEPRSLKGSVMRQGCKPKKSMTLPQASPPPKKRQCPREVHALAVAQPLRHGTLAHTQLALKSQGQNIIAQRRINSGALFSWKNDHLEIPHRAPRRGSEGASWTYEPAAAPSDADSPGETSPPARSCCLMKPGTDLLFI